MVEAWVIKSLAEVGREEWDALFPGCLETWDYLMAVEASALKGFRWRYVLVSDGGRLVAAAPAFLTQYALDTTLTGSGRQLLAGLRRLFPAALTLRLACLGSPCTETTPVGFAPDIDATRRPALLRALMDAFEREAAQESCGLVAVKDVPAPERALWNAVAGAAGYRPVAGQPIAHLEIGFDTIDAYLAGLSAGTRKDMRRKRRAEAGVRVEMRDNLDGVLDRVMRLYQETRSRGEMQFEELTPAYFTGVTARMPGRAFYMLYFAGDDLLAANLLIRGEGTLLDKFFCMDVDRGRPLNLYFLSWFTNLNLCLEHGLSRYQSGQAAYTNKLRLGSRLTSTAMYFRHRNMVVNNVLRLVAPLFAADTTARKAA